MVRKDFNLKIFLEYEEELAVRGKNFKEKISEFFGIVQVCHKVNRCLARYSPRATTTNRSTNRAQNKPAWPGPN